MECLDEFACCQGARLRIRKGTNEAFSALEAGKQALSKKRSISPCQLYEDV